LLAVRTLAQCRIVLGLPFRSIAHQASLAACSSVSELMPAMASK
jgi:hypothetical protein